MDSAVNTARYSRLNNTNGEDAEKAPGDAAHQRRRLIGKAQRTAPACVWWRRSLRPMADRLYFRQKPVPLRNPAARRFVNRWRGPIAMCYNERKHTEGWL